MSFIEGRKDISTLLYEFDDFIKSLEVLIKEVRPRTNLLNTRIGEIKRNILNIDALSDSESESLLHMASKYIYVNKILKSNAKFNKRELLKIIEGSLDYSNDTDQKYNDTLFELSIGARFLKGDNTYQINLDTNCDVILNDLIAIECKYLHSEKLIEENVKKAVNQINRRVSDGMASYGVIALDLTNIIDRDNVNDFFKVVSDRYISNYIGLGKKLEGYSDIGIISKDKNFQRIITSYISSETELLFYKNVDLDLIKKPVLAVIFQSSIPLSFKYGEQYAPIINRGMSYFINPLYQQKQMESIRGIIHDLVTGF